jgi:hypothetical protein
MRNRCQGVLEPGRSGAPELTPEDDGRVAFRVRPGGSYFLVPGLVTEVQQHTGGSVLRVVMPGSAFVIELLGPREPP